MLLFNAETKADCSHFREKLETKEVRQNVVYCFNTATYRQLLQRGFQKDRTSIIDSNVVTTIEVRKFVMMCLHKHTPFLVRSDIKNQDFFVSIKNPNITNVGGKWVSKSSSTHPTLLETLGKLEESLALLYKAKWTLDNAEISYTYPLWDQEYHILVMLFDKCIEMLNYTSRYVSEQSVEFIERVLTTTQTLTNIVLVNFVDDYVNLPTQEFKGLENNIAVEVNASRVSIRQAELLLWSITTLPDCSLLAEALNDLSKCLSIVCTLIERG